MRVELLNKEYDNEDYCPVYNFKVSFREDQINAPILNKDLAEMIGTELLSIMRFLTKND